MNRIQLSAVVLSAAVLPAQRPRDAASERGLAEAEAAYEALVGEYDAAYSAFVDAMRELVETDAYQRAVRAGDGHIIAALREGVTRVDSADFVARFRAGADRYAGDGAIDFLIWIATRSRDHGARVAAVEELVDDHVESAGLLPLVESMNATLRPMGEESWRRVCARIAEESPHAIVRAWAMYWPASLTIRSRNASVDDKAHAQRVLDAARALAPDTELAMRIDAPSFEAKNLRVGMDVPDIAGEDIAGVPFELSDYRGRVVVLDFWGDWCGPCRMMYPRKRALVNRLANEPFALLGVNSDTDKEALRKRMAAEGITWRSFWNGPEGIEGPISTRWNVEAWPTIYVIDHRGVIRFQDVRGERLDQAVDQLLAEMRE